MTPPKPRPLETASTGLTVALALSMLLSSLGTSIANIALPTLSEAFPGPFWRIQAVVIAYLAALTGAVVIAGRLGDRRGLKPMLIAGLALFGFASLFCAIAPTLSLLIGARAFQGIGAAFLMTLSMAQMRQSVSEARVGRAMGLLGTVSALGTAMGPVIGGLLLPVAGWRGIFWAQIPLAVLAMILAQTMLPVDRGRAITTNGAFWSHMNWHLARNLLINILVAAVMMATLVVGPFYLGGGLGLTPTHVGLVMAVGPSISILSGVPSGQMVDAWGSGRVLLFGLGLLAAGALLLALLPQVIGLAGYLLAIVLLTPGYQLFQAANNTAALAKVSKEQRGTVSGLLGLSRNIGLIVGASAMGAVFAFGAGTRDFTSATAESLASGLRLTFLLAAGMMLAAIVLASGLPERTEGLGAGPRRPRGETGDQTVSR